MTKNTSETQPSHLGYFAVPLRTDAGTSFSSNLWEKSQLQKLDHE